ncbi:hemerythrin domain-containing protein [Yinghuangia seranimata]|uniref:hemerythrin domain-containing protein n=1 Tax=Yinghuangia seranimata TaxID=408067 RepID=UPI00248CA658|nr:hemerythrin domain-containing protein [Yinghuangia seranimata]MDI2125382.1 hemerythrin domain-containing protein [Yinghuangia seranimata]
MTTVTARSDRVAQAPGRDDELPPDATPVCAQCGPADALVIDELALQHREIDNLIADLERAAAGVEDTEGPDGDAPVADLADALRHDAALERDRVYPAVRRRVTGGKSLVEHSLRAHEDLVRCLDELAACPRQDPRYRILLGSLRVAFRAHRHDHEDRLFVRLRGACRAAEHRSLRDPASRPHAA